MPDVDFGALLSPCNVSRESLRGLQDYVSLLLTWQARINLIGPSTVETLWTRHILDAVQLLPLLPANARVLADLGSGGGIPGLVVAIAGGYEVHLYESNGKKIAFLREAIRRTGAKAFVHQVRLERLADATLPTVDAVIARALAPLETLLVYAEPFMAKGVPAFFHKGLDIDSELTAASKCWKINSIKHPSLSDSRGVILEVKEAIRVRS